MRQQRSYNKPVPRQTHQNIIFSKRIMANADFPTTSSLVSTFWLIIEDHRLRHEPFYHQIMYSLINTRIKMGWQLDKMWLFSLQAIRYDGHIEILFYVPFLYFYDFCVYTCILPKKGSGQLSFLSWPKLTKSVCVSVSFSGWGSSQHT